MSQPGRYAIGKWLLLILLVLTAPVTADSADRANWIGVWGTNRLVCSSAMRSELGLPINFVADGDYVVVKERSFSGYEWACETTKSTKQSEGVRLDGACNAEGEEYTHWIRLQVVGDGEYLLLETALTEGQKLSYGRCTKSDLQVETADTWHSYKPEEPPFGTYVSAFLKGIASTCPGVTVNEGAVDAIEKLSRMKMLESPFGDADYVYNFGFERGVSEGKNVPGACDSVVSLFGEQGTIYPGLLRHDDI